MDKKTILKMCKATGMEYRKSSDPDCTDCWFVWDSWPITDMPDWMPSWANGIGPEELYAWLLEQSVMNSVIRQVMENVDILIGE